MVKLKGDGHIVGVGGRRFAPRHQFAVEARQFVGLLVGSHSKVGTIDALEPFGFIFGQFGAQLQSAVLGDGHNRVAHCHIAAFFHQNAFNVAAFACRHAHAFGTGTVCHTLVCHFCRLQACACLLVFFGGHEFVGF